MPGPPRRRPQRRGPVLLLQSALAVALLCAACGPTPQPAPLTPPTPPRPAPPQPDPPLPARWIETTWRGDLGPTLPDGTLVLLGGRRALLTPDGSLRSETTPAPELLSTLIAVPTPSGLRVVGRGWRGIYRFDDPLGPATLLARITEQNEVVNISPAPGMVAVWSYGYHLRSFSAGKRAEGIERADLTQGRAAKMWRMRCAWSDSAGRAPR